MAAAGTGGAADLLRAWGHDVPGQAQVYRDGGSVWTDVAWLDASG